MSRRVAYVCDVTSETLTRLDELLTRCGAALLDPAVVPHQEQECLVVAAFNLLRLQVRRPGVLGYAVLGVLGYAALGVLGYAALGYSGTPC